MSNLKEKENMGGNCARNRKGSADKQEQDGGRSRSSSERRKTQTVKRKAENKQGTYKTEPDSDIITCKTYGESVFTDDDDKLVECGRCESWECIKCSNISEKHYELLNDAILGAKLHWYCMKCNRLAISAVKN